MKKKIIQFPEYQSYVSSICRDIVLSKWEPDIIVGIARGGSLAAVMISHYFNKPCQMLSVSLRDHVYTVSDAALSEDALGYDCEQKNILIVDDINDTGATIDWIINDWPGSCIPNDPKWNTVWNNNVKFAVIVDNLSSDCSIKMDYVGFEVNKEIDPIWIEFPYENWWMK